MFLARVSNDVGDDEKVGRIAQRVNHIYFFAQSRLDGGREHTIALCGSLECARPQFLAGRASRWQIQRRKMKLAEGKLPATLIDNPIDMVKRSGQVSELAPHLVIRRIG